MANARLPDMSPQEQPGQRSELQAAEGVSWMKAAR